VAPVTEAILPSSTSISTPDSARFPPSQASSHQ
jgi:hypothetical protein